MAYEIIATRKRPKNFDELVGQEFVVATLKSAISQKHIAHAYLFSGPRGVGKTSAARILAKALDCENGPTDTPCGKCIPCNEITRGQSLDVIEIDGASNTSVNDVREIRNEVLFSPNSYRYKVYIIDEVHMLSNSAFNALLKTIEEPPPYIVFIFATTEIHKVPATIRSRCQQFNFRLISISEIKEKLEEVVKEMNYNAEKEALLWIAKESTGSLRDAYTLLDQVISFSDGDITLKGIKDKLGIVGLDELNELFTAISSGNVNKVLEFTNEILNKGVAVEQFVVDLASYFRNLLLLKNGIQKENILGYPSECFPVEYLDGYSSFHFEKAIEYLFELYRNLRFSLNQKFEFELVMSKLAKLKNLIDSEEILSTIQSIKNELFSKSFIENNTEQSSKKEEKTETGKSTDKKIEENQMSDTNDEIIKNSKEKLVIDKKVIDNIYNKLKRRKLALASALIKAEEWIIENEVLFMVYNLKDKFSAEMVLKDVEEIAAAASGELNYSVKVKIKYLEKINNHNNNSPEEIDDKVEMVKKVFKGEIIKGN
jgi:DNA polymerase-3 subunit gamma/tau